MTIRIEEAGAETLTDYARVSIAFEMRERFHVQAPDGPIAGLRLVAELVDPPRVKDYDVLPGNHPTAWPRRFDLSSWGILAAFDGATRVGGAVVAMGSRDIDMLGGRDDLAVLWDLRVAPSRRGTGVGTALFRRASEWAAQRGASWLTVETQDVNAGACRFYARMGCVLGGIDRFAYPDLPDETRLQWYLRLP